MSVSQIVRKWSAPDVRVHSDHSGLIKGGGGGEQFLKHSWRGKHAQRAASAVFLKRGLLYWFITMEVAQQFFLFLFFVIFLKYQYQTSRPTTQRGRETVCTKQIRGICLSWAIPWHTCTNKRMRPRSIKNMAVVLIRVKRNENDLRLGVSVPRGTIKEWKQTGTSARQTQTIYTEGFVRVNKEFSTTPIPSDGLNVREA